VAAVVLEDPPLFARSIMENDDPARYERFQQTAALASSSLSVAGIAAHLRQEAPDAPEELIMQRAHNLFDMDGDVVMHVVDQRIDWTPTIEGTLRAVQCPALLLQGSFELGAWMRREDGPRAVRLMKDCELSVWEDTGHGLHGEHPERFVEEVRMFLQKRVEGASVW
jgi:pimeloyl-ACP methyl ester carboxylesterase